MAKLIGGIAAFVAIAAGILNAVEPTTIVLRAGLAFLLGCAATQLWYVFFTVRVHKIVAEAVEYEEPPTEAAESPAAAA